ncbi:MAG TPA: glycosyltransferase family 2 protein [Roseiflexaceae bacterium]|nr:glycosyltransferase family 2 protein [Roseiflexaceae bacterium]
MTPSIAILIVSWNTCDLLDRCLATVRASLEGTGIPWQAVVVDNASSDGTPTMLRERHPDALLIESGRNLGFAGGNNLGLRRILEARGLRLEACDPETVAADSARLESTTPNNSPSPQPPAPTYVFLLNPDTEVVGDAIPRLVAYLEAHPEAAAVGPLLRYPDGSAQPSRRRFPARATFFWESTPLEQRWPGNPWARRYRMDDVPDSAPHQVDWLVGAALLVRTEAIAEAGLLDAGFAMYSEELEWQRRLGRAALPDQRPAPPGTPRRPIVFLPEALVIHHEGQSSGQVPAWRLVQFQRSRLRDAALTYGPRFAAALRLFLLAAYAAELATEAAKWLLGHKRPLRAARARTYAALLRALGQE